MARGDSETPGPARAGEGLTQLDFAQVAFAGHNRPGDLGDTRAAISGLRAAFRMLRQAGVAQARLLTGLAPGADVLAARAWRETGLGPVHAVYPFLDDRPPPGGGRLAEHSLWLDGEATRAGGRNPYLAQTRWLIGAADLLVVVWKGRGGRGAGGTADAVRLALEHGVPVLWVQPGETARLRLIRPAHLDEDFGFLEFLERLKTAQRPLVEEADASVLRAALTDLGLGVRDAEPSAQSINGHAARAYKVFRRIVGGRTPALRTEAAPADLRAQPGFERLSQAYELADAAANQLGAQHRSHQVILLGLAILAAVAGSASALWPELKTPMVGTELIFAIGALLIWRDSERGARHQHWGQARHLAEDLRLERAAWSLGVSTTPHGIHLTSIEAARRQRRLAGLPFGRYGPARVAAWGRWAMDELVAGQAGYHRGQGALNGRISHRVHQAENVSFTILMLTLVAYLVVAGALTLAGRVAPHWLGGLVFLAGAVVPAIGAAGLALEATLSLGEEAQRSAVLAHRLETLQASLPATPGLEALQRVAKVAIRLQRAQEDHWVEGAVRRRLVRGG